MARILGLDPGAFAIKAVLLETSFRGVSVVARAEIPRELAAAASGGSAAAAGTGASEGAQSAEAADSGKTAQAPDEAGIAQKLRAAGITHADQIIAALPGTGVSTQHMTLPFTDQKRISATLGFEVESAIPYDMAETAWDHQVLTTESGKSELIIGSARLDEVRTFLESLQRMGFDPRVVTSSALAYQNLFGARTSKGQLRDKKGEAGISEGMSGVEGILDIGHTRTSLCLSRRGAELIAARTFPGGGKNLTDALARTFEVSEADAEAWKKAEADMEPKEGEGPEMARAREAMARALAPMVREIRATLRAANARFHASPDRLHLTGGTSALKGLAAYLTGALGVEVTPLEMETSGDFQIAGEGAPFALATALALQGFGGIRSHRFNFRNGPLAFKGDLDFLKGKASRIGVFALILAVLAGISMGLQWRNVKLREASVDDALFELTKKVLGQGQKNYDIALNMLRGAGTAGAQLPEHTALDFFGQLIESAQKVNVKLEEVDAQMERVKFRGETQGFDGVDSLVTQLETVPCFREVKRNKVQKSKDGSKIIFELDVQVSCGGAPAKGNSRGR